MDQVTHIIGHLPKEISESNKYSPTEENKLLKPEQVFFYTITRVRW